MDQVQLANRLISLRSTDSTAAALFDWFGSRQKGARVTKARVAAQRIECDYGDIMKVFKKLEEIGVGKFVVGRKGLESRFDWSLDVKSLALMAIGQSVAADQIAPDAPMSDEEESMIKHVFSLRPNLQIIVQLPSDLRGREADRLAGWIKTLPFDDE
jgi:hypothetical protein